MRLLAIPALLFTFACAPAEPPETEQPAPTPATTAAPWQGFEAIDLTSFDPQVDRWLEVMTVQEKIGQMTQADMSFIKDESDIARYFMGSVLNGGGSDPTPENTFDDWRDMAKSFQQQAASTRLGIPLLHGVDAVHGHANVVGATVFPHNIGLGATRDAQLVHDIYAATASEVRATGIQWNFAPTVAVARDVRWGRTYESFGEDPELVAELGAAAVRGSQGSGLGDPNAVLATGKHFIGDGGTTVGTGSPKGDVPDSVFAETGRSVPDLERWPLDRGDTRMDEATLRAIHMPGYPAALEQGVGSIMPSFSSWNGDKLSGHKYLLTDVLKGELGFEGFLISDWAAIDDLPGDYKSDIAESINAGMDMVMVPDRYQEFFTKLEELVEEKTVPMSRIDDAVRRILRVKAAMGLLPDAPPEPGSDKIVSGVAVGDPASSDLASTFGGEAHRELARRAVQQSLVLLKNDATLPIDSQTQRIHVVGRNADDIGNQSGGWTVQWQGASGPITDGTTILEGIRAAVAPESEVSTGDDMPEGIDLVIAVIGETPYAEMMGDSLDLALDPSDVAAVRQAAEADVPVVTVLVSGRPMILGEVLDHSSALIAAWLPGSEGQGVADILFGDVPPTGKLSMSWPQSLDQLPQTAEPLTDANQPVLSGEPLFAYGFGLTY